MSQHSHETHFPLAQRIGQEVHHGKSRMLQVGPACSIFGGSRAQPQSWAWRQSFQLAQALARHGVSIISGGGPGVMEAANSGAKEGQKQCPSALSIGLNINIAAEERPRELQDICLNFTHFASRKVIFCAHSDAFVALPGGFGTLDELFEVLTLIQTSKSDPVPVILLGDRFWGGMMQWIQERPVGEGFLRSEDLALIQVASDWTQAYRMLRAPFSLPDLASSEAALS